MLIIDRIEGNFAVIECGNNTFTLPVSELPEGAVEGDCLMLCKNGEQTDERKKQMESLFKKITQKDTYYEQQKN